LAGSTYWLGATDRDSEQSWQWITGENFDYAPWESGQPDNYNVNDERSENYLCGNWPNWNDYPGYTLLPYVCEIDRDLRIMSVELEQVSFEFNGYPVTPEPVVRDGNGNVLRKDIDYILSYENNQGIGTAEVIAAGIGEYSGKMSTHFEIKGLDLGDDFWAYLTIMDKVICNWREDDYKVYARSISPSDMNRNLWHFKKVANGSYAVWSGFDNEVWDVLNYYDYDGATVQMHSYSGGDVTAQCWNFYRNEDGYGIMPMSSSTRSLWYSGGADMSDAPVQLSTTDRSSSQRIQVTILDGSNSANGYSITSDKDTVLLGGKVKVTVSEAAYVTDYKFHVIDPSGHESVVDNGCGNVYELTAGQPGTYVVFAEVSSPVATYCGSTSRDAVAITAATPLKITRQPQDQYAINGQNAVTSVSAEGDGLSYQWYVKNKTATKFSKSSVTKDSYTVKMTDSVDGRKIYCVVSDSHGGQVTTETATLYKYIPLSIVSQPKNVEVDNGKTAKVTVVAEGIGLTYQWYVKNKTATKFSKSSVKTNTYSVTMSDNVDGREIYCVVQDMFGDSKATNTVKLSQHAFAITSQPQDCHVANGETAKATVTATGNNLTYQWYIKNKTATKFSKSSIKKSTYSVTMSDSVDGRQVYCVVSDQNGNSITSDTATLHKLAELKILEEPQDVFVEMGETATVSVLASGSGLTYQWYIKNKTAAKFSKSSITKNSYSVAMSDKVDGRQLYCVITDKDGKTLETRKATIRKAGTLAIIAEPEDVYAAIGEKASVAVQAVGEGLTFQWYIKNRTASKFSKSSVTKNVYSVTMSDSVNGRQIYCTVTDKDGNCITTRVAKLTAVSIKIIEQPADVYAANGETAKTKVVAQGNGLTYQWYVKNAGASKFSMSSIKSATYSTTMSDKVDGRQAYCIITDENGEKVQTNTITFTKTAGSSGIYIGLE